MRQIAHTAARKYLTNEYYTAILLWLVLSIKLRIKSVFNGIDRNNKSLLRESHRDMGVWSYFDPDESSDATKYLDANDRFNVIKWLDATDWIDATDLLGAID